MDAASPATPADASECAEDVVWRRTRFGLRLSRDEIAVLDRFIAGRLIQGGPRANAQRTPA